MIIVICYFIYCYFLSLLHFFGNGSLNFVREDSEEQSETFRALIHSEMWMS